MSRYVGKIIDVGLDPGSQYIEPASRDPVEMWPLGAADSEKSENFLVHFRVEDIPGLGTSYASHWLRTLDASDQAHLTASGARNFWNDGPGIVLADLWPDPADAGTWLFIGAANINDLNHGRGRVGTFTASPGSAPVLGATQLLAAGMAGNPPGSGTQTGAPMWGNSIAVPLDSGTGVLIPNNQYQPDPSDFPTNVGNAGYWAYPLSYTQFSFTLGTAVAWTAGPKRVTFALPVDAERVLLFCDEYGLNLDGSINSGSIIGRTIVLMGPDCSVGTEIAGDWTAGRVLLDGRVLVYGSSGPPYTDDWAYLSFSGLDITVDSSGSFPAPAGVIRLQQGRPASSFSVWADQIWTPAAQSGPSRGALRLHRAPDGVLSDLGDRFSDVASAGVRELPDAVGVRVIYGTGTVIEAPLRSLGLGLFGDPPAVLAVFRETPGPMAAITADGGSGLIAVGTGDTVTFDCSASAAGDPDVPLVSWSLDFGEAPPASTSGSGAPSSPTTTHVYAFAATYHPTVTVTDAAGRTATASMGIQVHGPPAECRPRNPGTTMDAAVAGKAMAIPLEAAGRLTSGSVTLDLVPFDVPYCAGEEMTATSGAAVTLVMGRRRSLE